MSKKGFIPLILPAFFSAQKSRLLQRCGFLLPRSGCQKSWRFQRCAFADDCRVWFTLPRWPGGYSDSVFDILNPKIPPVVVTTTSESQGTVGSIFYGPDDPTNWNLWGVGAHWSVGAMCEHTCKNLHLNTRTQLKHQPQKMWP